MIICEGHLTIMPLESGKKKSKFKTRHSGLAAIPHQILTDILYFTLIYECFD